jgi:hypothetical protein
MIAERRSDRARMRTFSEQCRYLAVIPGFPLLLLRRPAKRWIGGKMKSTGPPNGEAASANITRRTEELGDWQGETLAQLRRLIYEAEPDIQEEWKWRGPRSGRITAASAPGIVQEGREAHLLSRSLDR